MCDRLSIQCIIPPYINDKLAQSTNPTVRARAIANIRAAATLRTQRVMSQAMPGLMASAAPTKKKQRLVYDAKKGDQLPGKLVRSEGQPKVADVAVNRAYDYSGNTYDFYDQLFGRNSLDNNGMTLISSVHVGEVDENGTRVPMNNAFWNGEQMAYGDGDGVIFRDFTGSLDVVGHELTHGVESFTSNLEYRSQSGALNEHFADVFGVLVRQWINGETAVRADWLIGAEVLVPAPTRRAIRDMENPGTAFVNDPDLGDDPQPGHMRDLYTGFADRGGVHINSGIPNRAFVLVAKALKGSAWNVAGRIWYDTMLQLTTTSQIADCARVSLQVASTPKHGAAAKKAVKSAWKKVGISL
jgi:Zn-dependent metalloprotease